MTRYEQGFINKCAEYGIDGRVVLHKLAQEAAAAAPAAPAPAPKLPSAGRIGAAIGGGASLPWLAAAGLGATAGALIDRKKRLRGALLGALMGIPAAGVGGGYAIGHNAKKIGARLANAAEQAKAQAAAAGAGAGA